MRIFSIILADDEQQILYGMKKGIEWEKLGFRVAGVAQNGKEALELMEEVHPDLVISDIKMPFMDGLELSDILNKLCNDDNVLRAKGFVDSGNEDWWYFDLVPGEFEIRLGKPIYTGQVCVIGKDLDENTIKELFLG